MGTFPIPSSSGYHFFVLFIDDFSGYYSLYPIAKRSDVYSVFIKFQLMVEQLFKTKIQKVQSDWGGQYRKLHYFLRD